MNISDNLCKIINHTQIPKIYSYFRNKIINHNHIIIMVYHRVNSKKDTWSLSSITPHEFEQQIIYLKNHYKIISLHKLIQLISSKEINKYKYKKVAIITFDDGYKDNYNYAFPIIKKNNIPVTIFLTANFISQDKLFWWDKVGYLLHHTHRDKITLDNLVFFSLDTFKNKAISYLEITNKLKKIPNNDKLKYIDKIQHECNVSIPKGLGKSLLMTWDEVEKMSNQGVSFGAHTLTHPILTQISLEESETEIMSSKLKIESILKNKVQMFAYPNGDRYDFNDEIINLLQKNRFLCAVTTLKGSVMINNSEDVYKLRRISTSNDFDKFKLKVSELYSDFYNLINKRI